MDCYSLEKTATTVYIHLLKLSDEGCHDFNAKYAIKENQNRKKNQPKAPTFFFFQDLDSNFWFLSKNEKIEFQLQTLIINIFVFYDILI